MSPPAGSSTDVPCPKCDSRKVKVALHTEKSVFFRCSTCQHVWSVQPSERDKGRRAS